jgi:Trk K+ transport system NAD-binding subunit
LSLADRLAKYNKGVILVIPNGSTPRPQKPADFEVLLLEDITQDSLRAAGLSSAKTLVALCADDAVNLRLSQIAAGALRIPNVVAQVNNPANLEAYEATGVNPVTVSDAQVTVLENLASNPNVFRLLTHSAPGQEVVELLVDNPQLHDKPMHGLPLPDKASIMVIQRDGRFIAPRPETRLAIGDMVTVLAAPEDMDGVCDLFACS